VLAALGMEYGSAAIGVALEVVFASLLEALGRYLIKLVDERECARGRQRARFLGGELPMG
jgi:hypothetical protein